MTLISNGITPSQRERQQMMMQKRLRVEDVLFPKHLALEPERGERRRAACFFYVNPRASLRTTHCQMRVAVSAC